MTGMQKGRQTTVSMGGVYGEWLCDLPIKLIGPWAFALAWPGRVA